MAFNDYPYTDFHEMNLDWVIKKVKELAAAWAQVQQDWTDEQASFANLQSWIENYFNNLDVQTEINVKIDAMVAAGTMSELIAPYVSSGLPAEVAEQIGDVVAAQIGPVVAAQISAVVADQLPAVAAAAAAQEVSEWLALHVDPDTGYVIDDTLTVQGAAADAKATGDAIGELKSALTNIMSPKYTYPCEIGNINYETGTNTIISNRLRSKDYIDDTVGIIDTNISDVRFTIFAYLKSDSNYVGVWCGKASGFVATNDSEAVVWLSSGVNVNAFRNSYPTYKFKILYRHYHGEVPTLDELYAVNNMFTTFENQLGDGEYVGMSQNAILKAFNEKVGVTEYLLTNSDYFELGSIDSTTGKNAESSSRYRTKTYIDKYVKAIFSSSVYGRFYLYAYQNDVYIGSYNESSGFTTEGNATLMISIDMDYFNSQYPSYDFRCAYRIYPTDSDTISINQIMITNRYYHYDAQKIRVMQFNIGRFDWGIHGEGLTEEEYQEKLPNYKRFLADYQADIVCLEEWEKYMDASHTHESDTVLFDTLYPYSKVSDHVVNKSIYPFVYYKFGILTPELSSVNRVPYVLTVYVINGKKVAVLSSALKYAAVSEIREAQITAEISMLSNYDYAIICNDLNCYDSTERDTYKNMFANAGYTIANGGYFADAPTYYGRDLYLDNIMTKGLTLRNFEVLSKEYENLSSDHFAIIADYVL